MRRETFIPPPQPVPVYTPPPAPPVQETPVRMAPRPAPVLPTPAQAQEDEIEIPAFIRKKMM